MYEPFSMDIQVSTTDLKFHQSATSVQMFTYSRRLGITYYRSDEHYYCATGIFADKDINNLKNDKENGIIFTSKGVWRKQYKPDKSLLHVGSGISIRTKYNNKKSPYDKIIEGCGVTSLFKNPLLYTNVTGIRYEFRTMAELLYISKRFTLQSEYFFQLVNRTDNLKNYLSHGGYMQGSILLIGEGFKYDKRHALPGSPVKKNSMELVIRLNYTNMNHEKADINGGEETDFSVGINYYFNKYFGIKFNYSYVLTGKHCNDFYSKSLLIPQARIQYIF